LVAAGLPPRFEEIDVNDPRTPDTLRDWGSPTILVDGVDIAGGTPQGACCRLYATSGGAPSDEMIGRALARSKS
jgi:hypothetical protein